MYERRGSLLLESLLYKKKISTEKKDVDKLKTAEKKLFKDQIQKKDTFSDHTF